ERARLPGEHAVDRLLRANREVLVDRREVDLSLAQEDLADADAVVDREHPRLAARRQELEQIGQRNLLDHARHRTALRRLALLRTGLETAARLGLALLGHLTIDGDDLDD